MNFRNFSSLLFLLFLMWNPCYPLSRNLTLSRAPGCTGRYCDLNIFYVKATGPNDTLHYLWDFALKPSVCLAVTPLNTSLSIDWSRYGTDEKGSISFDQEPEYLLLVILDKIIEFEDLSDSGLISNNTKNATYSSDGFDWSAKDSTNSISNSVVGIDVTGSFRSNAMLKGNVVFQLKAYGDMDYEEALPRLLHTGNSSQINIGLFNLSSNSNLTNSRWAVNFLVVSSDLRNETLQIESKRSNDDEYSPGDFRVVNIETPHAEEAKGAYLQWRPVFYTTDTPSISNSSDVAVMEPVAVPSAMLNGSLATKISPFYHTLNDVLVETVIVSFGSSEDGFYRKTNYSSWTFLMSYGPPQSEHFSMLVIMVMSIGLGLPAILIIGGIFVISIRRCSKRRDELSLER